MQKLNTKSSLYLQAGNKLSFELLGDRKQVVNMINSKSHGVQKMHSICTLEALNHFKGITSALETDRWEQPWGTGRGGLSGHRLGLPVSWLTFLGSLGVSRLVAW